MLPAASDFTQSLLDEIIDPVTLEPMQNAHEINCGEGTEYGNHLFDFETANRILASGNVCPLCKRNVTQSRPNKALQRLINSILGIEKGDAHVAKILELIRSRVKERTLNQDFYPLSPSSFIKKRAFQVDGYHHLCLEKSSDKIDCITIIAIALYKDQKRIELNLFFSNHEHMNQIKEALQKQGSNPFSTTSEPRSETYCLDYHYNSEDVIKILNYIIIHNTFEPSVQGTLREFLDIIGKIDFKKALL